MSKKHLKLDPHDVTSISGDMNAWWYEENDGIHITVERRDSFGIELTEYSNIFISWRKLRSALARKDS